MKIIEFLFPKQCGFCSRVGFEICPDCLKRLVKTLPTCCICKRLNNGYWTHRQCLSTPIQCFTGWYMSEKIQNYLNRKKSAGIYSSHLLLLNKLIVRLGVDRNLNEYSIHQIVSTDITTNRLNRYLAKKIGDTDLSKSHFLLIGECIDRNTDVKQLIEELPHREPLICKIICIFEITQSKDLNHSH